MNPYTDNSNIRTFAKDVDPMSLIWHEDQEDREIEILEGEGWKFQFDEQLPFELNKGDKFFIPKGDLHRVIKGNSNLIIKIYKK